MRSEILRARRCILYRPVQAFLGQAFLGQASMRPVRAVDIFYPGVSIKNGATNAAP
jgi:hypothetical protein